MGFFLGLLMGLAVGVGLVMTFVHSENTRSKRRAELAATVAAFSKMTVLDSRKILPAQYYPSWVVFSQRQKLNWLNVHLTKIWPYINEAASELIRTSFEPILEQYKSAILASLSFSKLTLGTVAPQFTVCMRSFLWEHRGRHHLFFLIVSLFTNCNKYCLINLSFIKGVSILEDGKKDSITMELELQWDGNPSIILDIRTALGVALPIQVKNIGFTGVFRVIFKPLVDQFPCFGAVAYSLREKKKLDFTLKVVGGELSSVPGLSDAIQETIHNAVEDSITWPVRNIIPIIPGVDISDLQLKPEGILEVKLVQAKDLTNKDIVGKSDPFAKLYVRPLPDKIKTSKTINNDLNPIWNENFEFIVEDSSTQNLVVKIYDDEGIQAAELIGCAQVRLKDLPPGKVKDIWLKLVKDLEVQRDTKERGQVHLELLYCPYYMESQFSNPFVNQKFSMTSLEKALKGGENGTTVADADRTASHRKRDVIVRGVLSVTVISGEDLPPADIMGKADPYIVLQMKKTEVKNKTRVVNDSLNPQWNQTFDFVVEDGLHDMLILEVWDHDTFGKDYIGRCIMTLTRVIMEGEFEDSFPLENAKSGKLKLRLKWKPQPIFRDP